MSSTRRITPAGDGFYAAGNRSEAKRLAKLEQRLAHEFMGAEERCELRERILRLRRSL